MYARAWVNIYTYAAFIDEDEIEVAYLLDENNGAVAKDISANARHGNIIGAKWVKGMFGNALEYDGFDDNILVPGYHGVGGKDPRTTFFWFKSSETRDHSLSCKATGGQRDPPLRFMVRSQCQKLYTPFC